MINRLGTSGRNFPSRYQDSPTELRRRKEDRKELTDIKRYDSYQDTGVEWLSKMPSYWSIGRLGGYFLERRTKVSDVDFQPLSVTKSGIVPRLETAAKSNDGDNRRLVREGDFVINSRSDRKGSSGIARQDGSVSLINIVLKTYGINPLFVNSLLKSYAFVEEFYRNGHGIVADLWTTRFQEMKNIKIPIPPATTQTAIATFLDRKTAQIDRAIAQKERLIELLKERKQIIIQRAVTKGLDPTVKMKDSGVEWIGEIPEGWEVKKLKNITSKIGSGVTPSGGGTTYIEEGVPFLRSQNIHFGSIDLDGAAKISLETHQAMSNSKVKRGDILLNITGGSIGRCHYVQEISEINVNQHVCIVRPSSRVITEFLNAALASEVGQAQTWYYQQGGGREGLNFQNLKNFFIALPPINEQKSITTYLEDESSNLDQSINLQTQQIAKLKEYRTVLIDAAVTGKIKIS